MGKLGGFVAWQRVVSKKRAIAERLRDWDEVEGPVDRDEVPRQAGRCMDCGVPFCHAGCPLGNPIPEFADLVWNERWLDAHRRLAATNEFPELTGRLCPAPCEAACVLAIGPATSGAVAIESIEKAIAERAFAEGWIVPRPPLVRTGKRVAIVGSGPAGLAAAARLNRAGHTTIVYEAAARPGGLLRYGIPDFKLGKHVIDRRLAILEAEGVELRCNVHVGTTPTWDQLRRTHDAVVLAIGAQRPRDLAIPGRDLPGVVLAMDYLVDQNVAGDARAIFDGRDLRPAGSAAEGRRGSIDGRDLRPAGSAAEGRRGSIDGRDLRPAGSAAEGRRGSIDGRDLRPAGSAAEGRRGSIDGRDLRPAGSAAEGRRGSVDVRGKRVAILGGGDTGSDCLGTALRQGAAEVTQIELLPAPPEARALDNPWPTWPLVFRTSSSQEEGGARTFAFRTTRLEGDAAGRLVALHGARIETGESVRLAIDVLILALGFVGPELSGLEIGIDARGNIAVDEHGATTLPGVFCAGDAHRGASLIVWAIAEGRDVAHAVEGYLRRRG